MIRRLCIYLLGERKEGEYGYYRRLARVESQIRKLVFLSIATVIAVIALIVVLNKAKSFEVEHTGAYVPDHVTANGALVDTDGDGDYYHWEE